MNASALLPELNDALDRGSPRDAILRCEAALARDANDAEAHRHLGSLLQVVGRHRESLEAARRATRLVPDDPRAWSDLGRVLAMQRRFAEAVDCFREALSRNPRHADAWHNLGTAWRHLGRRDEAFTALKRALVIDGNRTSTWLNLGALLIDSQQLGDALECLERAARLDPGLAHAQCRLAGHLASLGNIERAESHFRKAVSLDPTHIEGWLGLGRILEDIGDEEGAMACYRNVLARDAGHAAALGHLLSLLRAAAPEALISAAHQALEDAGRGRDARALIGYGLAKYHDRRRDFAAAAAAARRANEQRRQASGPFDRAAFDARVADIIATCDRDFFAQRRGFGLGTDQPVFIVGLPRSGTTLTEQIIASHPLMHGAGELPDLPRLAARLSPDAPWKSAGALDVDASRAQAFDYLRALRDGAPRGRLRITDKSPFNFFQLGFAALLFPQARVIHCRRNARDNALSIWLENFNPDQHYATDFADIACLRRGHDRLMAHWREVLPLRVLEVDYEALVADTETQARRIVAFLGAPWDRRCLDFHATRRPVRTPSRWQVRQPIYSRSVDRWRQYAPYLPELALISNEDPAG